MISYLRGRISKNKLEKVFEHTMGKSGFALTSRLSYAIVFGPLFAWYLLARGVKGIVTMTEPENTIRLEFFQSDHCPKLFQSWPNVSLVLSELP